MKSMKQKVTLCISIVLILIAGSVYWNEYKYESEYVENVSRIKDLQTLERQWSISALQTQFVLESDFDRAAAYLLEVRALKQLLLGSELTTSSIPENVSNQLYSFIAKLDAKEEAIERFKSGLAIVRNSIKYFPIATDIVIQRAVLNSDNLLEQQIKNIEKDLQSYIISPNDALKQKIQENINRMNEADIGSSHIISHANVLLAKKEPTDELFELIAENDVVQEGGLLVSLYSAFENQRLNQRSIVSIAPYIICLALFSLVIISKWDPLVSLNSGTNTAGKRIAEAMKELEIDNLSTVLNNKSATDDVYQKKEVQEIFHEELAPSDPIADEPQSAGDIEMSDSFQTLQRIIEPVRKSSEKVRFIPDTIDNHTKLYGRDLTATVIQDKLSDTVKVIRNVLNSSNIDEIKNCIGREGLNEELVNSMFNNMAILSRTNRSRNEYFDINRSIDNVVERLKPVMHPNISIRLDVESLDQFIGVKENIEALITNLFLNAAQALEMSPTTQKKQIMVKTRQSAEQINIVVFDTGDGIPTKNYDKLFTPFFTENRTSASLGLGLTTALKVVTEHNGQILSRSAAQKGTAFQIRLPKIKV